MHIIFQESKVLLYACRNCDFKEPARNNCIYVNKLMHEIDELRHINPEVIQVYLDTFQLYYMVITKTKLQKTTSRNFSHL